MDQPVSQICHLNKVRVADLRPLDLLAERRNVVDLETLENSGVHRRVRNKASEEEDGITERSVNNRPRYRNVILYAGHLPCVIHMAPGLRQLIRHKQRSTLRHPRVNGELDSATGNRVDKLCNRSPGANSADLVLADVQQVVQGVALEQHVIGETHKIATVSDNLRG